LPTTGYISLKDKSPEEFVEIIEKKLIYNGGTIPSENLRSALSTILTIPRIDPKEINITVKENDQLIQNAQVVLIADNGTSLSSSTDSHGNVKFKIKTKRLYSVLVCHPDFPSAVSEQFDTENDLSIELSSVDNVGSILCHGTCYISGLQGRLAPILDISNRMYFYADNIAIERGKGQPVSFEINNPIQVEDCDGTIMNLIFRFIKGKTSVIDYIKPVYE
jgi:hypothetical protein